MEYAFHVFNKLAADGANMATEKLLRAVAEKKSLKRGRAGTNTNSELFRTPPVIVCIGSDLAIGDSLGPVTGSMLKYKTQGLGAFIYGTLSSPVTAKEIRYVRSFLKETHKDSLVIAVDAAVGVEGDVGLIKISDTPLLPGAGANKKLGAIGDISVMGIVAERSIANYGLFNTTRLNLVYTMSEIVSDALSSLLWERCSAKNAQTLQNA
ncbi:MAG: spore protease YyaC [Clostridia bacterium]|nr:spore protease YyaC [Clostridia bacterium]